MKRLTLDEMHAVLLEILTEFDRVCREHGLKYTLAAGTLLGAIRHKGFIPWDDDVDVYMPRPDYEKFYAGVKSGEIKLGEDFLISTDRGKGTYYPFLKLMDKRYPVKCPNHIEVPYLFLDIFPVDGMPSEAEERKKLYKKERRWNIVAGICQWYTMDRWWGFIAYIIGWWFYLGVNLIFGRTRAVRKMNEYALSHPFETSEMVGMHSFGQPQDALPREAYENFCEIEFEGRKFYAISAWEQYLTQKYGATSFRELPPENKRRSRHYMKAYRRTK